MNHATFNPASQHRYVLRFASLFADGRGLAFPCDARGEVDVAALSPSARRNYLSARDAVGRDYGFPAVRPAEEERWH
jgi:hypothetical protein